MQVLGCPKTPASKPYIASLVKVLAGLPLGGCSQETVKRLRSLAGALAALFCLVLRRPATAVSHEGHVPARLARDLLQPAEGQQAPVRLGK